MFMFWTDLTLCGLCVPACTSPPCITLSNVILVRMTFPGPGTLLSHFAASKISRPPKTHWTPHHGSGIVTDSLTYQLYVCICLSVIAPPTLLDACWLAIFNVNQLPPQKRRLFSHTSQGHGHTVIPYGTKPYKPYQPHGFHGSPSA